MKSSKIEEKIEAFKELIKWQDPNVTKEDFLKGLHFTVKERNVKAIPYLIDAIESLLEDFKDLGESINLTKFLEGFTEIIMDKAKKGKTKKKVSEFIPKFFNACFRADLAVLEAIKKCAKSIKPKIAENMLTIIY